MTNRWTKIRPRSLPSVSSRFARIIFFLQSIYGWWCDLVSYRYGMIDADHYWTVGLAKVTNFRSINRPRGINFIDCFMTAVCPSSAHIDVPAMGLAYVCTTDTSDDVYIHYNFRKE